MSADTSNKVKKPSRSYKQATLKILYGQSGNQCAEPSCSNSIIASETEYSEAKNIAHIAHIYAFSEDGPRGKSGLTKDQLNHHTNLLLLCPTHHAVVDTQHETYPADLLLKWKADHIRKHSGDGIAQVSDIGYAELELAARSLMADEPSEADSQPTSLPMPPQKKIEKNGLSQSTAKKLRMGVAMSREVEEMLRNAAQLESGFPDSLREGFQTKYNEFVEAGLEGDDLFDALYVWAGGTNTDPKRQLAALCILSHLFVLCEVFESE